MAKKRASVVGLVVLVAALGAVVVVGLIDRSDPVEAGGDSDHDEAAPPESQAEYEVDSLPPDYQQGPVDTDRGSEVSARIYAYLEGLEGRAGEPRITPDRTGFEVPIVDLTEQEVAEVGQLSTGEITVTATVAAFSVSELETIAVRLAEHVEDTDAYVILDTELEQVVLASPEPLPEQERSQARSIVDEVLSELVAARVSVEGAHPDSLSGVTSDDVLDFVERRSELLPGR